MGYDTAQQHRDSHCFVPQKKGEKFKMVVYKEFSSLINALGFSGKALYSVSNHINRHYSSVKLPKKNGEFRQLYVPDEFLKSIQRAINEKLLSEEEISPYATAYRPGGSTRLNAYPHMGKQMLLKLDIRHFFDHLIYPVVKEKAFPKNRYSEQNRVLLSLLCVHRDSLPQGAPTSPTISNIIMKDFDNAIGRWCENNKISYTRYCDDMTFSGDFDPKLVIHHVKAELGKLRLFLNDKKTVVAYRGQKHYVTGIVVNEKLGVPAEYKRKIRQEMYYCMKFGVASHIDSCGRNESPEGYVRSLLGRVNYALSIDPKNEQLQKYKAWLQDKLQKGDF